MIGEGKKEDKMKDGCRSFSRIISAISSPSSTKAKWPTLAAPTLQDKKTANETSL
jgi:hypothetical protein